MRKISNQVGNDINVILDATNNVIPNATNNVIPNATNNVIPDATNNVIPNATNNVIPEKSGIYLCSNLAGIIEKDFQSSWK